MNLFGKKSRSLATPKSAAPSAAEGIAKQAGAKIQKGLDRPIASTGTPMEKLHGGPKFMAQVSNIGGGSVKTGGGGIKGGLKTMLEYTEAVSTVKAERKPVPTSLGAGSPPRRRSLLLPKRGLKPKK